MDYSVKSLHRYWIKFERIAAPTPLNLGCGVTAFDRVDALRIVRDRAFAGGTMPEILEILDDVDVSQIDSRIVTANMGSVLTRGIWFPLGL